MKGYRTQIFNVLNAVSSASLLILAYLQTVDLSSILSPKEALMWIVGINVVNIILRQLTTGPVGNRDRDDYRDDRRDDRRD